jgi:hypothetical protein
MIKHTEEFNHDEPLRDCRRLFGLSYAAMAGLSMAAVAAW